jgi:Flagellar hook-length control protein FliK
MSSAPVFAAMNPQATPNAAATGTSQAQAQIAAAPQAMPESINQAPQQAATSESAANAPTSPTSAGALPAGTDLKPALALFQQLLKTSLDNVPAQPYAPETGRNPQPEPRPTAANNPPPPPYRGGPTSAQPALPSTLPVDASPRLVGEVLLNHTEAALAHLKLLQIASLPDSPQGSLHHEDPGPRLMFEIPFSTPHGSAIAQFEIRRDGRGATAEQSGPVWRARFSLDVEPMGPVHAQIVLMGERVWVTLWAEREASVQILRDKEALLSQALKDSDVVPEVAFCLGAPHRRVAAAGQFLDRAS